MFDMSLQPTRLGKEESPCSVGHYPPPISFILLILLAIFCHSTAQAATFTVTSLNDSGAGSLRQAVLNANALLGADTIVFRSGLTGIITLTSGQIEITDALTINGPGAGVLAISGNNKSRIFFLTNTMNGKVLTINQLTLKNAYCCASGGNSGGAIYGAGSLLTINNCTLNDNNANEGGAIYMSGGALTVNNSALIANQGRNAGGGIRAAGDAAVTVNNSTLAYNISPALGGGGIFAQTGPLVVNNSTIFGNSGTSGGGIRIYVMTGGYKLSVNNSTISGNSAATGGGIYFQGNNSNNTGAIANSIVAGNFANNGKEIYRQAFPNGSGLLTSLGHNLFGENGADGLVNVTRVASDRVLPGVIGTALGPLAYNGGPTKTLLPVNGSLAINRGSNALIPAGFTTDQRGTGFPRIVNSLVDIGSVEAGSPFVTYRLTVDKKGGNGRVASLSGDINCGLICADNFSSGAIITLTATADAGYQFNGWSGDCNSIKATCSIAMNAAKNVTALFSNATTHLLTVTKAGYGLGTVTGPGINCGADCTQPYPVGTKVTLTATATTGSTFGGWSNCDTVNVALRQCTVTMANARTVNATFNRPLLTVSKTGTGAHLVGTFGLSSGIFCGTDCTEAYNLGAVVYLVALPRPGSTFVGWNNCVANANFPQLCTTTMTVSKTVTAKFSP